MVARRKPRRKVANPTRYARETGTRLPRWREKLAAYEADGGYFVHFSNFPKLGINPVNKFDTPTGFYAYPLDFTKINRFANERPYALIVRPVDARLWRLSTYSVAQYRADLAKLEDAFAGDSGRLDVDDWMKGARVPTLAGRMWNITRHLAGKNTARWTRLLYSVLGYDGVVDDCEGIIHPNEVCQAVFFDVRRLEFADVIRKSETKDLHGARNMSRSNFAGANFFGENLYGVIAPYVNFSGANLASTRMYEANLRNANLSDADLRMAQLSDADLRGANLVGAKTAGADFFDAKRLLSDDPIRGWHVVGGKLRRA